MPAEQNGGDGPNADVEMKEHEQPANGEELPKKEDQTETKTEEAAEEKIEQKTEGKPKDEIEEKAETRDEIAPQAQESEQEKPQEEEPKKEEGKPEATTTNGNGAPEAHARDHKTPANILEKGIIYFFFRGRVGIDEPTEVGDIARSYIMVRPIQHDAKLGQGPIGDVGNSRLIALPKKVLPLSGKDRFLAFVEKSHSSFKQLKDEFLSASDYDTKTAGVHHTPAATPLGEGVYCITTTGRESHLAYILTIPSQLGEVQKEIGLRDRGSFIISTRNPAYPPPANTSLPEGPSYPQE